MPKLTQARLKNLLYYDPETGMFTGVLPKKGTGGVGSIAGTIDRDGYRAIMIDGKKYTASRLAFLYIEGYFPEFFVDHKNRIKDDNKWGNLRHVSRQCNNRNAGNSSNNTSGVKGVHYDNRTKKWIAQIMINRKKCHLGYYEDFDNAVCARFAGEQFLNWASCDSNSPAFKYVQKNIIKRSLS